MTQKISDWGMWEKLDTFTIDQAAALLCDETPSSNPSSNRDAVKAILLQTLNSKDCWNTNNDHPNHNPEIKKIIRVNLGDDTPENRRPHSTSKCTA